MEPAFMVDGSSGKIATSIRSAVINQHAGSPLMWDGDGVDEAI